MIYFLRRNLCLPTCWLELPFILFYWNKENNESQLMVRTILLMFFALFCIWGINDQLLTILWHRTRRLYFILFWDVVSSFCVTIPTCFLAMYSVESPNILSNPTGFFTYTCLSLVFSATYHLIVQLFLVIIKIRKWFHVKMYSHRVTFLLIMIANTD